MNWKNAAQRYGIACFEAPEPDEPEGTGDSAQFFDQLEEAQAWAKKAIKAGRFKYLALWDGQSGDWIWLEEFKAGAT